MVGLFGILRETAMKIITLPDCFGVYMFEGIKSSMKYFYGLWVPTFLRNFISYIYNYLLMPVFTLMYYVFLYIPFIIIKVVTGTDLNTYLTTKDSKCMKYNIKSYERKLKDASKQIIPKFKPVRITF